MLSNNAPESFGLEPVNVTWTSTDASGNTAMVIQTLEPNACGRSLSYYTLTMGTDFDDSIRGTAQPDLMFLLRGDDVVFAERGNDCIFGGQGSIGNATATDIDFVTITNDAPELYVIGTTHVTWTATDASGNTAVQVQSVTIQDTTSPSVIAPGDIVSEATAVNTPINTGTANAYDAIGIVSITNDAPTTFLIGTTLITWTAIDEAGNTAFAVQQISIVDSTSPIVTAPANLIVEAESSSGASADIGIAVAEDIGDVKISNNAPEIFPLGETQVTWTATDASGNVASAVQNITVSDTTAPVIVVPANMTVESVGHSTPVDIGIAHATDAAGTVLVSNNAPKLFLMGSVQVTWTATDDTGNTASAIQIVTVQDTVAPSLTPPADVLAEAESSNGASADIGIAVAKDIGDVEISNNAPEIFPLGETQVTWTATDASGNVASAIQTVMISDTVAPVITAPVTITVEAESAKSTSVSLSDPHTIDISGIASITNNAPEKFTLGETVVTWTVMDNYENTAITTQTVHVVDTTPPVIDMPSTLVFEISGTSTLVHLEDAMATDLVDGEILLSNNAPESFGLEPVNVTWTSTDASGNTAMVIQTLEPNACGRSLSYYTLTMGTDFDDSIRGTAQPDSTVFCAGTTLLCFVLHLQYSGCIVAATSPA